MEKEGLSLNVNLPSFAGRTMIPAIQKNSQEIGVNNQGIVQTIQYSSSSPW